jgi:hypothetical protein
MQVDRSLADEKMELAAGVALFSANLCKQPLKLYSPTNIFKGMFLGSS